MVIAALMLGGLLLVIDLLNGGDSGGTLALAPTSTPLPAALGLRTSTAPAGTAVAGASSTGTPGATGTAATSGTGTPTTIGTPGTAALLPDRTSCSAIIGTDYRSPSERAWYIANCPNPTPGVSTALATATSQGGGATGSSGLPGGVQIIAGGPAPAPRDPFLVSFETLVGSLMVATVDLASRVAAPDFLDASWRGETVATAREIQNMGGAVALMVPPNCLVSAHGGLRSATFELGVASGLVISAIEQNNNSLLRLAAQRVTSASVGLPVVQSRLAAAEC